MVDIRVVSRGVRTRGPRSLVTVLRRLTLAWGRSTARWRMEPSFIIVGAQRAGTTSLFRVLSEHPAVVRPTQSKGVGYFDLNYHQSWRWYLGHFPLRVTGRRRAASEGVTFESSGYYLFHPAVPSRLAQRLPEVKVVVMVRDPVERAMSAHRHESARGFESESFERAVDLEPARLAGEGERIAADPAYESFDHRHHGYLARSRYSEQIRRFVDALGADQVYVVDADRFFALPELEFAALTTWLGLPDWRPDRFEQWNARPSTEKLDPAFRQRLLDYFEPYDRELAALMGRAPSWRRSDT